MKQNKQTLIRYTYSNNIDTFKKVFTLEEVEGGCQFEEISDSPLLRDYRIVNILLNSGAQAFKLEQWCKDTFKGYKYVGESPFKLTGITEIFNIDISVQPEFMLYLNKLKDINE